MNKTNKSEKMAGKKRIILLFDLYKDERIISLKEIERRIRRASWNMIGDLIQPHLQIPYRAKEEKEEKEDNHPLSEWGKTTNSNAPY